MYVYLLITLTCSPKAELRRHSSNPLHGLSKNWFVVGNYVKTVFLFLFVSLFCFAEHFVLITIQLLSKDMVSSLVKIARKYCFLKIVLKSTQAAWK